MKWFLNYSSSDLRVVRNDRNKVYIDYTKQKSTDEKKIKESWFPHHMLYPITMTVKQDIIKSTKIANELEIYFDYSS